MRWRELTRCCAAVRCDTLRKCVLAAIVLASTYLCIGELLPLPAIEGVPLLHINWGTQQVVVLAGISCLAVLLASAGSNCNSTLAVYRSVSWAHLLAALNCAPVMAAVIATLWSRRSDNCGDRLCSHLDTVLDVCGLISARLARLDLALALLLASRGDASWLMGATKGSLGYAEAIPLHRTAGWWCCVQSALHSITYLLFYLDTGGWRSVWLDCLPVATPGGHLNRLGLVNGFGVLAFFVLLALALPAWPQCRQRHYNIFQRLHRPAASVFLLCSALHDLEILLFAVPALAAWLLSPGDFDPRRSGRLRIGAILRAVGCARRHQRLRATARVLDGTSGPWVELTVDGGMVMDTRAAPRGQWGQVRVVPLGRELHPLSLTLSAEHQTTPLSVVVSAGAGDWSRALAALAHARADPFDVKLSGPFAFGGGWSLGAVDHRVLLLAGGVYGGGGPAEPRR